MMVARPVRLAVIPSSARGGIVSRECRRTHSQAGKQHKSPVPQRLSDHTVPEPTARRDKNARQKEGDAAAPSQAQREQHVFEKRSLRESAEGRERGGTHDKPLITIG